MKREINVVRSNMIEDKNYVPYCGAKNCHYGMIRTKWNGEQMECLCGWESEFPKDFIDRYKLKHSK